RYLKLEEIMKQKGISLTLLPRLSGNNTVNSLRVREAVLAQDLVMAEADIKIGLDPSTCAVLFRKCFSHMVSTSELVFDYGYLSVTTVVVAVVVVTIVAKVVIMREIALLVIAVVAVLTVLVTIMVNVAIMREIALLVIAVAAVVVDVTLMVELTNKCPKH
nr:hypothetical protein [Tanacetum cinerariifolium]